MKDIIPAKKQSPILGLTGMGGGVGSNIVAGGAKKTYAEDVYSTYVKSFHGSTTIVNNIDLAEEGGMVWTKIRNNSDGFYLGDTVNGVNKTLLTNVNNALANNSYAFTAFNNNGFTYNDGYGSPKDYATWTFRKAPGFFDVVTWTGNGSTRTIAHNLKCNPGCIMVKNLSNAIDWAVWHRGAVQSDVSSGAIDTLKLNTEGQVSGNNTYFDNGSTPPTKDNFTVHTSNRVNASGDNYIAYVYAGGASDEPGAARSVDFDGSGDYLSIPASNDLNLDGDFTIEAWVKVDVGSWGGTRQTLLANSIGWTTNHAAVSLMNSASSNEENTIILYNNTSTIADSSPVRVEPSDGWTHIAITRSGSTIKIFKNGVQAGSTATYSGEFKFGTGATWIGAITMSTGSTPENLNGKVSNLRVIKGTALYTSAFKPPTKGLENVTNTKLLCCNKNTVTGSTVTTGTITANGNPQTTSNTPFDDPDNFIFGEDADQNMIKCGNYVGNNDSSGPIINLGWEPQWILIKRATGGDGDWVLFDNMRGLSTAGLTDSFLPTNENNPEVTNLNCVDISATGFELKSSDTRWNGPSSVYVYMAIRRPDGYVGKPLEAGTDAFAMDMGSGSSTIPEFDSGFPVDFALMRQPASSENWYTGSRLTRKKYVITNSTTAENSGDEANWVFDSQVGWCKNYNSDYQSWMWKRHVGMDVVGYTGAGAFSSVPHSLSKTPEMIWVKKRNATENWVVYHKDLNGGTTPENYYLEVNTQDAEAVQQVWNYTAPTSTYFTVGGGSWVNGGGDKFLALLFTSVTGISKVGSFAGSSSDVTLNLGFVPRFLMVKGRTGPSGTNWTVWDSLRGITGGGADTPRMYLNAQSASSAGANDNVFTVDSGGVKGITIVTGPTWNNHQDYNYIYYAHA